jgi:hydrogenase maturation protease
MPDLKFHVAGVQVAGGAGMKRILVAGIGNIFLGDDGFGIEVSQALVRAGRLPRGVRVIDFGIRAHDLAHALTEAYDAAIFVDAIPRGHLPGTIYLIEPDVSRLGEPDRNAMDANTMNPFSVLQIADPLGGKVRRLFRLSCEPADVESEDGQLGLSATMCEAVPRAVELIQSLVNDLLKEELEAMPLAA